MSFLDSPIFGVVLGVAVGVAFGFAAPAAFAAIPALAGTATAAAGFSFAAATVGFGVGTTIAQLAAGYDDLASSSGSSAQHLVNSAESEFPRTYPAGRRLVGYSKAWFETGVPSGPNTNANLRISGVIADTEIEEIEKVIINDDELTLGVDLIINTEFDGSGVSTQTTVEGTNGTEYTVGSEGSEIPTTTVNWTGHPFINGEVIRFAANGGTLPAGISEGNNYRCYDVSANLFRVRAFNGDGLSLQGLSGPVQILSTSITDDGGPFWALPVSDGVYIPASGNKYRTVYEGEREGPSVWHFAIKFFKGDQTVSDTWMDATSTSYAAKNRVHRGQSYFVAIIVANPKLGLAGQAPNLTFLAKGAKPRDPNTGTATFSRNPAHIFPDFADWRFPAISKTANFDDANLIAVAADCDAEMAVGEPARYRYDKVIRWQDDPEQALREIAASMRGGWNERGDKLILWAGVPRAPVMALTKFDLVQQDDLTLEWISPPEERANSIVPHFIAPKDADGRESWQARPGKEVTDAAWVTIDGGKDLERSIQLPFITRGKRAKFHAWIEANQGRSELRVTGSFSMKTAVLDRGDVVTYDHPEFGLNVQEMWVVKKQIVMDRDRQHVALSLREYSDAIYVPGAIEDEDPGQLHDRYDGIVAAPTGLAAAEVADTAEVRASGRITADVAFTWDEVDDVFLASGGGYKLRIVRVADDKRKVYDIQGQDTEHVVSLQSGRIYRVEVRAYTQYAPSEWSSPLEFAFVSGEFPIGEPPAGRDHGDNLIVNPAFKQQGLGWSGFDSFHSDNSGTGSISFVAPQIDSDQPFSDWCAELVSGGTAESPAGANDIRLNPEDSRTVDEGEFLLGKAWFKPITPSVIPKRLELVLEQEDGTFISTTTVEESTAAAVAIQTVRGIVQVPHGGGARKAKMRMLIKASDADPTIGQTVQIWKMRAWRVNFFPGRSQKDTPPSSPITGTDWQTVVGLEGKTLQAPPIDSWHYVRVKGRYSITAIPGTGTTATLEIRLARRLDDGTPGTLAEVFRSAQELQVVTAGDAVVDQRFAFEIDGYTDWGAASKTADSRYRMEAHFIDDTGNEYNALFWDCSLEVFEVEQTSATT